MDMQLWAILTFRSLALLAGAQGKTSAAATLNATAAGLEAGLAVDEHMRDVAAALAAGGEPDLAALEQRITATGDALQARATPADT